MVSTSSPGALTPAAFAAAADPAQVPEHLGQGLRPWAGEELDARSSSRLHLVAPPTTHIATGLC